MHKHIPLNILFGNPLKTRPKISPDGSMISYIAPFNNVLNIWLKTRGKEDDRPLTNETKNGIEWSYFWAYDGKHILYEQDDEGNEELNIFAVNIETEKIKNLTPFKNVRARILSLNKRYPAEILITMNRDNPELFDVHKLNPVTGESVLDTKNPGNVTCWLSDNNLRVRGAIAGREDGGYDLLAREPENAAWKRIAEWDVEQGMTGGPEYFQGFSGDNKGIYALDPRNSNTFRLVKIDARTGESAVIAEHPRYDAVKALIHPDTCDIQAVLFEKSRKDWSICDESIKADFDAITKMNDGDFQVINRDNADEIWIVSFTKDNASPSYYSYDRRSKTGDFLFCEQSQLDEYALSHTFPISFTARDGLKIHGYMTYPHGKERENLPMVLKVHGGPWWRDSWGFDPEVQFFADRGYACLQVNYRGSTGYGKDFINAANKEWAGKVMNDLEDGVRWVMSGGIAHPQKTAIYGRSWGGYCALLAAANLPDLFCCAVDVYGISNLVTFIKSIPPYWAADRALLEKRMGNPETGEDFLKSCSPLYMADRIKIPLLIAHGANDVHVKESESGQIVAALKKNGTEHQYILFPDEGHGFSKPENRLKFYNVLEGFLKRFMGR